MVTDRTSVEGGKASRTGEFACDPLNKLARGTTLEERTPPYILATSIITGLLVPEVAAQVGVWTHKPLVLGRVIQGIRCETGAGPVDVKLAVLRNTPAPAPKQQAR